MTEETYKTNPARRLLEILEAANNIPNLDASGAIVKTRTAWCRVFEIPEPGSEEALLQVLSRLVALRKLFNETESALRAITGINEDLFIRPVTCLEQVVNLNGLANGWGTYSSFLNVENMTRLQYAVHLLSQSATAEENEVPVNELKELLIEVDSLIESLLESLLPHDLKTSLITLLNDIRKAILEYRIRGAVVLKEALAESIGVLAVNKEALDQNKDSEDLQALGNMLIRIDKLYMFAMKMKPLLEAASNILPALASHIK